MLIRRIKRRLIAVLRRAYQYHRVIIYRVLSDDCVVGHPRRVQPVLCSGRGTIHFDESVSIGFPLSPSYFSTYAYLEARNPGAKIFVGARTWINNNFRAIAEHRSITIGRDCRIGPNVEVLDSDFHGLEPHQRNISRPEWAKPVVIEDNVFVGGNVVILKGVRVGTGSVIANGSVVTKDVPPMTVVGGNPARVVKMFTAQATDCSDRIA